MSYVYQYVLGYLTLSALAHLLLLGLVLGYIMERLVDYHLGGRASHLDEIIEDRSKSLYLIVDVIGESRVHRRLLFVPFSNTSKHLGNN